MKFLYFLFEYPETVEELIKKWFFIWGVVLAVGVVSVIIIEASGQ